jgi:L-asparaginase II
MRELSAEGLELLATLERDEMLESFHHGLVALVDPEGNLVYSKGDVFALMYPRSALKPIQASAMRQAGLKLDSAQAVMSMASHHGTEEQVGIVSEILAKHGLTQADLACPEALPWDPANRIGATPSRIFMNCSGKHAGFLAASKLNGWELGKYLQRTHPMQKLVKKHLERLCGEKIVRTSTDGCGAPLFATSTVGLARAISSFVQREPELVSAALAHPHLIGSQDTPDAGFLKVGLFSKLGAEGVFTVATTTGHAIAMKVADGSLRMAASFSAMLLNQMGLLPQREMVLAMNSDKTEVKGGDRFIGGWDFYF